MPWKSLITGGTGIIASIIQNAYNAAAQERQNKHNEMLVDKQNAAARLESERAYTRQLPSMQMANMRAAGLSDAAAAGSISGGATYHPAPVNTAQGQAPQIDMSSAIQAATSAAQMRSAEKMQRAQLKHAAEQQEKDRQNQLTIAREQNQTTREEGAANRDAAAIRQFNELQQRAHESYRDYKLREQEVDAAIKVAESTAGLNDANAARIREELYEWRSQPAKDARDWSYRLQKVAAQFGVKDNEFNTQRTIDSFNTYLQTHYTEDENGNLVPRDPILPGVQSAMDRFWDLAFRILPIEKLKEIIRVLAGALL